MWKFKGGAGTVTFCGFQERFLIILRVVTSLAMRDFQLNTNAIQK